MRKCLFAVLVCIICTLAAKGQGCAVCTKTAAGLDEKSARGLNGGIIYLALLPLGIMGTLGYVWWRSDRHSGGAKK